MTNLPPLPLVGGCLLIDNSGFMENVNTCTRKQEYQFIHKRILAEEKPSLEFGSLTHATKELRYCRYASSAVDDAYYNDLSVLFTEFYEDHAATFPDSDWRNINFAMEMVRRYDQKYPMEDFRLLEYGTPIDCPVCEGKGEIEEKKRHCLYCLGSKKRSVMVEMPFTLPLFTWEGDLKATNSDGQAYPTKIPVIYIGKIDLPTSRLDGDIWIDDHKTTKQGGQPFWDEQRMSAQHRGYCWAFKGLTGMEVKGYEVNMIRTKEIPQYAQNNKTFTVTQGRNKGKKLTADSFWDETFQREKFLVDAAGIEEWHYNTIDLVEEFMWHYCRNFMPMKTKWCSVFGRCAYYEICTLPFKDRIPQLMSGQFTNNEWSPLKK